MKNEEPIDNELDHEGKPESLEEAVRSWKQAVYSYDAYHISATGIVGRSAGILLPSPRSPLSTPGGSVEASAFQDSQGTRAKRVK